MEVRKMKKIILVRHASAEARGADKDDFDRSLRKKGRKEAQDMIEWYLEMGEEPDLLLTSPANRAIETARIFAKGLGFSKKEIMVNEALYDFLSPGNFLKILQELDDAYGSVMIFGHDPAFSEFAKFAVHGFEENLPKCSVFGFIVKQKKWRLLRAGEGKLAFFTHPQGICRDKQRVKERREELSVHIEKSILQALIKFGIAGPDKELKKIRRASARIAKIFTQQAEKAS
jgi:phosphohistidine phosphatase